MFRVPEVMFMPETGHLDPKGYHDLVYASYSKLDPDLREPMLNNIILTGGNTMFEGFPQRLWHELNQMD